MSFTSTKFLLTAAATAVWSPIDAQAQSTTLVNRTYGCAEVGCPVDPDNNALSDCQVVDKNLLGVGISQPSNVLDYNTSWTLGISGWDNVNDGNSSIVGRSFYYGQPEEAGMGGDGCALFIVANENGRNRTLFDGGHANQNRGWIGPSCSQSGENGTVGLPDDCTAALRLQSRNHFQGSASSCQSLAEVLNTQVLDACNPNGMPQSGDGRTSFLGQSSTVYAVPLTGPSAPGPISNQENSTSNCWPTLPQTNELAEVFSFNITVPDTVSASEGAMRDITPILSVWRGADGFTDFNALCVSPILVSARDAATAQTSMAPGKVSWTWLSVLFALLVCGWCSCV